MLPVGFLELVIIAVFALVFIGPKRLPEVMKQAGRLFVHLRRTANDVRSTFDQVIREAENEIRKEEADKLRQALTPGGLNKQLQALVVGDQKPTAAPAANGATTTQATGTAQPAPEGAPEKSVPIAASVADAFEHVQQPGTTSPAPDSTTPQVKT